MAITLNPWFHDFPEGTVGGSLYAVPRPHRHEAAALLHHHGCRLHLDVIIGPDGHRGVTWAEMSRIRAALPQARIDLHLIVLDTVAVEDEAVAIDITRTLHAEALTLTGSQITRHSTQIDRLRKSGAQVWEELTPDIEDLTAPEHVDGALAMLITPGTKQAANLDQLDKLTRLAARMPVGVDGGVTSPIAQQCHDHGARYLISGRDLLLTASTPSDPNNHTSTQERRSA